MDNLLVAPAVRCRWYVLAVIPHSQLRVCERAKELGISTYCPMSKTIAVVRHRKVEIVRPLMPGYVFIALPVDGPRFDLFEQADPDSSRPIPMPVDVRSGYVADFAQPVIEPIRGCLGFVPDANGARGVIADDVILSMREREAKGDFDITGKSEDGKYLVARWVKRGVLVRFVKGPFTGYLGTIDRVLGPSLVRVDVTIFNRTTQIDAPMDWIERVR